MIKFTILRESFLKPLRAIAGAVERRQVNQTTILSNILIEARDNKLILTATDQEVELISYANLIEPYNPGKIIISYRKLIDICKCLPDGCIIYFSYTNNKIILSANRSRYNITVLPVEKFPVFEEANDTISFNLSQKVFRELLAQGSFAMADQDVRYFFNGMLFELKNNEFITIAADGHRLAVSKIRMNDIKAFRVIVPRKGILEMIRILSEGESDVNVAISERYIKLKLPELTLTSKLLEGRFPEYESLLPKGGGKIVLANREALKNSFMRVAALLSDKTRAVHLFFKTSTLRILALTPEKDEAEEDLEIEYDGDELEIGFNVKYLLDCLNVLQTKQVKITLYDANSSILVEGLGVNGGLYIIMPRRI